jgi:hypothetical protein
MSGCPFLLSNACGKGISFLVNTMDFPGHENLSGFYRDILYFFCSAFQKELLVEAGDSIRFSTFEEDGKYILYFLNTDPGSRCEALITYGASVKVPVEVGPGCIKVVYLNKHALVIPEDPKFRIVKIITRENNLTLKCLPFQKPVRVECYLHGKKCKSEISTVSARKQKTKECDE